MPDRDVFYVADPISSVRAVTTGSGNLYEVRIKKDKLKSR
jgi:hypothetical protein